MQPEPQSARRQQTATSRWQRYLSVLVAALAVAVSLGAYFVADHREERRIETEFRRRAESRTYVLQEQVGRAVDLLFSLRTLFVYSEDVTRQEFHGAAADLLKRHPEIQAVEWVPRVRASEREACEAAARQQGLKDFRFTEPTETGGVVRAGERSEYWPIYFVEPLRGNEIISGWDTLAGPNREMMERARDTGELVGTGKLTIKQDIGGKTAWILALPIYKTNSVRLTLEERRQTLRGFLRVVFRIEDLFDPAWENVPPAGLDILILDKTPGVKDSLFYYYPSPLRSSAAPAPSEMSFRQGIHHREVFNVAGRQLRVFYRPVPEWVGSQWSGLPELLLAGGLLGAVCLRIIFRLMGHRTEMVEEQVAERTSSLTLANELLKKEVAERKHAEELLRRTHASLVEAQRIGHIGSWELDLAKNTLAWSEETFRIFGRDPQQFTPTPEACTAAIHREDVASMQAASAEALRTGNPYRSEHRIVRPDGSERVVLEKVEIILDAQGKPIQMIGTVEDITERKQAEAERLRMERKLQETQKLESLGLVAGGIAHDFNNLLTGILGNASLAHMDLPATSPARPFLQGIEDAAARAADLCRQMLAYAGKGRFVITRIDLSRLVADTTHLLELAIGKNATLQFHLANNLPPVLADATQMRQVIMNLVINASEALGGKNGTVSVTTGAARLNNAYLAKTHLAPELPEGDYVFLEVSDTGCGMDTQTLAKIFDPFFSTKFAGRGLGLAAVQGIVRGHKGAIKVYSEPGRGSSFKVLLPSAAGRPDHIALPAATAADWRGAGVILVVDDEDTVRSVAERMLASFGFKVLLAKDGQEGLDLFRQHAAEIVAVLLDLTMPRLDGEATFREMRQIKSAAPVLLMSGFNEQDAINRFVGKGLAGFVQKPFKAEELREKLRTVLGNNVKK